MLTPAEYTRLTPKGQRHFLLALPSYQLQHFTEMLNKWLVKSAKDADILALFAPCSTISNVRFNAQMLKRSKQDTFVDIVARYPQLKSIPAVMELVAEDFNKVLRPLHRHL